MNWQRIQQGGKRRKLNARHSFSNRAAEVYGDPFKGRMRAGPIRVVRQELDAQDRQRGE